MKKVLIMGNNDHMGGLIIHYVTLVRNLKARGYDVTCININDTNQYIQNGDNEFIISYKPVGLLNKLKKFFTLRSIVKKIKQNPPDIFIATGLGYGYVYVANALPKSTFKVFEEVHFDAKADKLRLKMIQVFDAVAPQTFGMISEFKKNVHADIPINDLPCFAKEYNTKDYSAIPDVDRGIRLVYFGRLAWNKGLKEFILQVNEVFQKNKNITFDIYGKGPEELLIQNSINDANLGEQIKLKGFYEDKDFVNLLSSYHSVVLPSIATEGLPLIILEAMQFGRPILCSDIGAMPEVAAVNSKGMIVSKTDQFQFNLEKLAFALKNNEFDADYINKIYLEEFSNNAFVDKWQEMIENPNQYFNQSK